MTYCWVESLGDCSDKLSREHIVSEGMFPDQVLRVVGGGLLILPARFATGTSVTRPSVCALLLALSQWEPAYWDQRARASEDLF
jgi:hypothetical protein